MKISRLHYPANNKPIDLTERANLQPVKRVHSVFIPAPRKIKHMGNVIVLNRDGRSA